VTDQAGTPLAIKPCEGCISLVLRAPEDTGPARIQRYANGAWADVETIHAGILGMYSTNPTALGDYALVTDTSGEGNDGEGGLGVEQIAVAVGAGVILLLLFGAALLNRRRDAPLSRARSRPIPSKRKRQKRPPPGRPDR
jgi:hypothetical protein